MSRRLCPKCGAPLTFSAQKFCTGCGTTLPEMPVTFPTPAAAGPAGIPLWVFATGAIIVLLVVGALIVPSLVQGGTSRSAGTTGNGDDLTLPLSPSGTPMTRATPVTTTRTVQVTLAPTTLPTTLPTTAVPTTTSTLTPTPIPTTTVPSPTPTPEPTSVIMRSVTQVPQQPPTSSYTSSTPGAPYIDPSALEARVHSLINVQRQQNGLSTLSYDPFLADIARGHSWNMVVENYFEHVDPNGLNARGRGDAAGYPCIRDMGAYTYEGISENLYQGHRAESYFTDSEGVVTSYDWDTLDHIAERAVNGWMLSPGHRENILTPHFSYEGIGVAFASDDKIYITENFC